MRQLEAYSYPLNIAELKTMVERAAAQSDNSGRKLSEDVFWFAKQVGCCRRGGHLRLAAGPELGATLGPQHAAGGSQGWLHAEMT